MDFAISLLSIIVIDLVLSGDNAVVIAMATRRLPSPLRRKAIFWGSMGAIGLRTAMTVAIAWVMKAPFVQLFGGVLLVHIAVTLVTESGEPKQVEGSGSFRTAIRTIIAADFVMSLDNVLAIGGVSQGDPWLLVTGLTVSMGFIMWGSRIFGRLLEDQPALVYVGAGLLLWTASQMILSDQYILRLVPYAAKLKLVLPLGLIVLMLGFGAVDSHPK